MCGRYSITVHKSSIEYHFNARFVSGQHEFAPSYNAAPSPVTPKMNRAIFDEPEAIAPLENV